MPFDESHPVMNTPKENIKLWRYMDLASFFSLLVDSSLTFARADLMEDKFEGTFPQITAKAINAQMKALVGSGKLNKGYENFAELITSEKDTVFLNCWCKEQTEMVHMWKIYSKEHGIAIETSYNNLKKSVLDDETAYPSEIRYADFRTDHIDWQANGLTVFTIKRIEYKSESEFRLIISHPRQIENQLTKYKTHKEISLPRKKLYQNTPVIKYKVNIEKLIKNIHVSPYAPKWYPTLIQQVLNKLGFDKFNLLTSDL